MMNPHYHTFQEVMNVQKTCAVCNHIQVKGLQRQIEALKQCLEANGIVLNSKDDEWMKAELPPYKLDDRHQSWEMGEVFDREREVKG